MSATPDLSARLRALAELYYRSLKDQLYDPDPKVDGYDKETQKQHITDLLCDLARDAANLVLGDEPEEG